MKKYQIHEVANECIGQLNNGVFLTTKDEDKLNTMTIGWGYMGIMWKRPIIVVAVRKSRHTYQIIEKAQDFTLSFPQKDSLKKELEYCGSNSGKDIDKFKEIGLNIIPSYHVTSPIIKECGLFIEAKIIYRNELDPSHFCSSEVASIYDKKDYHVYYHGEIVDVYKSNE